MKSLFLVIFFLPVLAFAQLERNVVFKTRGTKVVTTITMQNYVATRKLLYYIPKSVDLTRATTVVVYLHGGNSNMTQDRALDTADMLFWGTPDGPFARKDGIRPIAEKEQFIVVMPTTTTGWNDQTPFYMREVLSLIRRELNPDPNKIFLMGHSMGAMGICRSAGKLADEFAMFFPMSGGFQPHLKNFVEAGSLFNTKVYATSGGKYEFPQFVSWNVEFEQFLTDKYTLDYFKVGPADWTFVVHDGTHNPNMPMMEEKLHEFVTSVSRNLYRPNLFGSVFQGKSAPGYLVKNESKRYFWLEATDFRTYDENENDIGVSFRLYSHDNVIDLYVDRPIRYKYDTRPHLSGVKLHLSEKLFDLARPIRVNLITKRGAQDEASVLFDGLVERSPQPLTEDKGFKFEAALELKLPRN